ncbi:hypothetical protein ASG67_14605 [Sphingomonas sp. Leaf339]|uniref:sialate O-acetylesterase n=1 Tax=Sphingomonas sp. Leaf339 TaxID=1736343 RepID=UPI0006FA5012|nr:sialate O-acetylesterase [Sphingomonas sp. Leaf339]KQU47472.1 hypothetical protein ASG67_14605 [Sphingomonas sp. Leaf339]
MTLSRRAVALTLAVAFILSLAVFASYELATRGWTQIVTGLPRISRSCPSPSTQAFLVIGQSHASNTGVERHRTTATAYAFADGDCYPLMDPMPGTTGRNGSVWPAFADALGHPSIIANISISGSAIEQWTTPAQMAKVRRTLNAMKATGYRDPIVIFMQGETNAALQNSAARYYDQLRQLISVDPTATWIVTRESICGKSPTKWQPLDDARDRLAREYDRVVIGPDLDRIPMSRRQDDKCHLTSVAQTWLGQQLAATVRSHLAQATE